MSELRRHMMVQQGQSASDYIQDGLIFWLDGIDKGGSRNKWRDIIGGLEFVNYGAIENDDHFYFDGASYMIGPSGVVYDITNHTIEVCVEPIVKSNWVLCTPSVHGYVEGFSVSFQSIGITYAKSTTNLYDIPYNGKMTISMNIERGYGNMNSLVLSIKDYFSDRNLWVVGGRTGYPTPSIPRYLFNGKIYAIRIYNKLLTSDEMIYNQQIDNLRFNLGI